MSKATRRGFLGALVAGTAALGLPGTRVTEAKTVEPPDLSGYEAALAEAKRGYATADEVMGRPWTLNVITQDRGYAVPVAPITVSLMQADCTMRGCSIGIERVGYGDDTAFDYVHRHGEREDSHPWYIALDADHQRDNLVRVNAWRRSLHESGA